MKEVDIPTCGEMMYLRGYNYGVAGNISVRKPYGISITASGTHLGFLQSEDLVIVTHGGKCKHKNANPSSEVQTHLSIYNIDDSVNAVIHVHPVSVIAAMKNHIQWYNRISTEQSKHFLRIKTTELYHKSGSKASRLAAMKIAGEKYNTILMLHHGVFVTGNTLFEAFVRLEMVCELAELYNTVYRGLNA